MLSDERREEFISFSGTQPKFSEDGSAAAFLFTFFAAEKSKCLSGMRRKGETPAMLFAPCRAYPSVRIPVGKIL